MISNDLKNDLILTRFQSRGVSEHTKLKDLVAMGLYLRFLKEKRGLELKPADLIHIAEEDRDKSLLERGMVELDWVKFVEWLRDEYTKKTPKGKDLGVPLAASTLKGYASAIKSFYAYYGVPLGSAARLPKQLRGKKHEIRNKAFRYRPEHVQKLISVCRNNRDKAIMLMLFQGGFDPATLFSLNLEDVMPQMERNERPMLINVERVKEGINYRAIVGTDAILALSVYLKERTAKRFRCKSCRRSWRVRRDKCPNCESDLIYPVGWNAKPEDPLFVTQRTKLRLTTRDFARSMREWVKLSGIIHESHLTRADISPGRPYALRSAFSSILKSQGLDPDIIDGLQGHKVRYDSAYTNPSDRELKKLYSKYEAHLSIGETHEIKDLKEEFEKKIGLRDEEIQGLEKKNLDLEERLLKIEDQNRRRAALDGEDMADVAEFVNLIKSSPRIRKMLDLG